MGISEIERGRGAFLLVRYQETFRGEKEEHSIGNSLFDETCSCRYGQVDYGANRILTTDKNMYGAFECFNYDEFVHPCWIE